ncbi:MAG: phosphotyrosine protein phosphatase [Myxococcales bacterium]|nr:MAG: phosphotyrosine protein phosphatase [Myxococcales bacterium]
MARQHSEAPADGKRNVLFICSKNQWRSPTAEAVWRKHPALSVRSAGTSSSARRKVSVEDVRWADVIFVMEEKHKSRLLADFTTTIQQKPLHVLDIPDEYKYMDPALVEQVREAVAVVLGLD